MEKWLAKAQWIVQNGRPQAVVLGIRHFQKLLELAEDAEDLRELRKLRKKKQSFTSLDKLLSKRH